MTNSNAFAEHMAETVYFLMQRERKGLRDKRRGAVRPWMFRLQPLLLMSSAPLRRYCWRQLRAAVRSVSPVVLAVLAARARAVAGVDVTAELQNCAVPLLYLRAAGDWVVRPGCWELVRSVRSLSLIHI